MFKKIVITLIALTLAGAAAQAIVLPVKSAVHQVQETLFVPYNYNWGQGKIRVYTRDAAEKYKFSKDISLYARVQGVATYADKLYLTTGMAENSRLMVFPLGSDGVPTGDYQYKNLSVTGPSLSPAEVLVDPQYSKVYVADGGAGRIHVHDLNGDSTGSIIDHLAGQPGLFGLAISDNYLFVSQMTDPGAIYVFNRQTNAYVATITNAELVSPSYMKVIKDGGVEKLFVAVNSSTSYTDILVFNANTRQKIASAKSNQDDTPYPAGYTGFDITPDNQYLVYSQYSYQLAPSGQVFRRTDFYELFIPTMGDNSMAHKTHAIDDPQNSSDNFNGLVITPDKQLTIVNHADERSHQYIDLYQLIPGLPTDYFKTAPVLNSVSPDQINYNVAESLTLTGTNFINGAGGFEIYVADADPLFGGKRKLDPAFIRVLSPTNATGKATPEAGYPLVPGKHKVTAANNLGNGVIAESQENVYLKVLFANITGFTQRVSYTPAPIEFVAPHSITLKWDPVAKVTTSNEMHYELSARKAGSSDPYSSPQNAGILTESSVDDLVPDTKYQARVQAFSNDPGITKYANTTAYTFTRKMPSGGPDYQALAFIYQNEIKLEWYNGYYNPGELPGNPEDTQYEIGRKQNLGDDYTVITPAVPTILPNDGLAGHHRYQFVDTTAQSGVAYYYGVRALNKAYFDTAFKATHPNLPRNDPWETAKVDGFEVPITKPGSAEITLVPTSLTFNAVVGGSNPASQTIALTNSGTEAMNWTATDNQNWLSIAPQNGALNPAQSATLTASVDVSGLIAGTYNGKITVAAPEAKNTPQEVNVTLIVSPAGDTTPPGPVTNFTATGHDQSVALSWTNPVDADYSQTVIARATAPAQFGAPVTGQTYIVGNALGAANIIYAGNGTSYNNNNPPLTNGTHYFYRAWANDTSRNYSTPANADATPEAVSTDTVSPAAISDLKAAVGSALGNVNLTWTAVGDDGNTGTATSYIVKYSYIGPITNDTEFNAATTYTQAWVPKAALQPLQPEIYSLTGLNPGEQIWVSIKARDEVPNTGPLGNCAATIVKNNVPPPVIEKIYPNKGPNDKVTHIIIKGQNLYNDMTAAIVTPEGSLPLENIHQYDSTMVAADIPLKNPGIAPGTYEVTITCPGGTYDDAAHANPNNNFTVIAAGSDTTYAATVENFAASDNNPNRITLAWTNPADGDLREILVMRKPGSYPTSHTDGTQAYQSLIPEPGAAIVATQEVPADIAQNTTYSYAVFSRDTSDNWNDTVDSTQPLVNADTGIATTESSATPEAVNVSIKRDADTVGASLTVTWKTLPQAHQDVDIWVLERTKTAGNYTGYFTTEVTAQTWTKLTGPVIIKGIGNDTPDSFTDTSDTAKVGQGTQKYYKLIPQGVALTSSHLAKEVAGKFDLAVGPEADKLFMSIPLEQSNPSPEAVFGAQQVLDFDIIALYNINKDAEKGSMFQAATGWQMLPGAGSAITGLATGEGYGFITTAAREITIVGKVREAAFSRVIKGSSAANWIAPPYPLTYSITGASLNNTSANANPTLAAMVIHYDANAESIGDPRTDGIAIHTAADEWKDGTLAKVPAPLILVPGKSYMLLEPGATDVTWSLSR